MIYKEKFGNLFSAPDEYYLAHCISADFGMGRGIAVEFNNRFDMKNQLMKKHSEFVKEWDSLAYKGTCLLEMQVFNLVTKRNYWNKPTYQTLTNALIAMKNLAFKYEIKKIAMPIIGCGLDRLEWTKVSQIIQDVFSDTDMEILVLKTKDV